jgi:oxepin-CoA hydrolase/3-oxo-5,6-dehydrosuberyl-CoA semialdehyde dehydrogenase
MARLSADAATGEPVAIVDSTGVDFAGRSTLARSVGARNCGRCRSTNAPAMLKALGQALKERKEEFYTESFHTGATRSDAWVDIEGGIGTMLTLRRRRGLNCRTRWC